MKLDLVEILKKIENIEIQKNEALIVKEKSRRGRPSKTITLPRYIKLIKENLESLGIFLAEGTIIEDYNRIELTNSEPKLLKKFLEFLEILNIDRNEVKVKLEAIVEGCKIKNELELKKFWSKKLKVPLQNFQKVIWFHRKGSRKKPSPYGVAQLRVYHKLLTKIFYKLLHKVSEVILDNKKLAVPFLRGIFGGDGCVEGRKRSIHSVIISCVKHKELIKNLLIQVGIMPGKYNPRMRGYPIRGIKNFEKIYKMQLLKIHPAKNKKFIKRLKNHRYFYRISSTQR